MRSTRRTNRRRNSHRRTTYRQQGGKKLEFACNPAGERYLVHRNEENSPLPESFLKKQEANRNAELHGLEKKRNPELAGVPKHFHNVNLDNFYNKQRKNRQNELNAIKKAKANANVEV